MILSLIIWLFALIVAITIHEFAHAWVADRLGDPTPRMQGRLSLNPRDHYDPTGTSLLLITVILRAFGTPIIPLGWAKPVEFDPFNLANPKRDAALIALAGPTANFLLALILGFGIKLFFMEIPLLNLISVALITLNVSLGVFNLVPIAPLDGSKILMALLPEDLANEYTSIMSQFGSIILIMLIIPWRGVSALSTLISPIINFFLNFIL